MGEKWENIYTQQLLYISLLMLPLHGEWNLAKENENCPRRLTAVDIIWIVNVVQSYSDNLYLCNTDTFVIQTDPGLSVWCLFLRGLTV